MLNRFELQKGNVLVTVLISMGILGFGTSTLIKHFSENKKIVKNIAIKKETEVLEKKLKSYLMDYTICAENFKNKNVNSAYTSLKKNNKDVLKLDAIYLNGTVKIREIRTSQGEIPQTINLHFSYEKISQNQLGGNLISKKYLMKGEVDANDIIQSCYLDDEDAIGAAFSELMARVCNGPGVIATSPENRCTVLEFDPTSTCASGQVLRGYFFDSTTQKLRFNCENVLSQIGTGNQLCQLGLKATSTPGVFECFSLNDLVSSESVIVNSGAKCKVDIQNDKIRLHCNDTYVPPPSDPEYTTYTCNTSINTWSASGSCSTLSSDCLAGTANNGDSLCCSSTPSRICVTSSESSYSRYRCNKTLASWTLMSGTCTELSSNCVSGNANDGEILCCSSSPTATCKFQTGDFCGHVQFCHLTHGYQRTCFYGGVGEVQTPSPSMNCEIDGHYQEDGGGGGMFKCREICGDE